MNPRRGLTPRPDDQAGMEETELEMSAIRRGLWLNESQDIVTPRRASPAGSDEADQPPTLSMIDLSPAPSGPRRAQPAADVDLPEVDTAGESQPDRQVHACESDGTAKPRGDRDAESNHLGAARSGSGRRRWSATVIGITIAGLASVLGLGAIPAEPAPAPTSIPLVTAISRICPAQASSQVRMLAFALDGGITSRAIGETQTSMQEGALDVLDQSGPLVISPALAGSGVTGGSLVDTDTQQWWAACQAPLEDQYVQLPGGANAELMIVNPESSAALIDVTLSGPDGEITGEGLRGMTIEANSQRVIDLGQFADSVDAVGARVRTSLGRVSVSAQVSRDAGGDFATSTVQGTDLIVSGVPAQSTRTVVLLTNPGTSRNVVQIDAISEAGRFTLPGYESVTLNAQRTTAIDLTDAIGSLAVSLEISAREPVAASTVVSLNGDFAIEAAEQVEQTVAHHDLVAVVAGTGTLQLANPGNSEASVSVDWGEGQANANRKIPAGNVATIDIPAGASEVRVTSTAPLFGAIAQRPQDGSGFAIARLEPAARAQSTMPVEVDAGLGR